MSTEEPTPDASAAKGGRRAGGKDIFKLAVEERDTDGGKGKEKNVDEERSILITGSKRGGKSSVVLRFLDRLTDVPKPTMALEYTFGRRPHSNNLGKDIAHLWELGGGAFLTKLMDSVITGSSLRALSCVVVIDLSKPKELWGTLTGVIKGIRERVDRVLSDLIAKDSRLPAYLRKKAWSRIGEDHPDKDLLDPLPVPLVILGSKYDLFQDFDSEHRKIVCKTLRFVAHINGGSLHFVSDKDEGLLTKTKALMNGLAFKSSTSTRGICLDHNKPLIVAAGADSLQQIGAPSMTDGKLSARDPNPLELWHEAFDQFFPPDSAAGAGGGGGGADGEDPSKNPEYHEGSVDEMRAQKDEMLERYRKQADRRARELAAKHAGGGSSRSRKSAAPPSAAGSPKSSSRSRRRGGGAGKSSLANEGGADE